MRFQTKRISVDGALIIIFYVQIIYIYGLSPLRNLTLREPYGELGQVGCDLILSL